MTHSIGAKQISDALSGIGLYNDLSISFDKEKGHRMGIFVPGWDGRSMKGESRDRPFRILESNFCNIFETIRKADCEFKSSQD